MVHWRALVVRHNHASDGGATRHGGHLTSVQLVHRHLADTAKAPVPRTLSALLCLLVRVETN